MNRAASKSLQLQFQLYKNVPQYIQTDLGKLRQVLINLLSNAIKFTEQGKVVLRVGVERKINRNKPKRVLIFDVVDTGIGIAASEQSKLFDPFERTDNSSYQEGTGLGLAISQEFIKLMGGKIRVKSCLGKGSSFKFSLLATIVSASDVKKVAKSELNQQVVGLAENQPHYRILVADDIDDNRLLIKTILSRVGFEVIEAVDGTEAISQWQRYNPQLIFMDIQMPGMSGYEATRWIKSTVDGRNTVIIALTASAFREKQQLVFEAGCDDFIAKPFRVDIIFEKIARYLEVEYLYENTGAMPELSGPLSEGSVSSGSLSSSMLQSFEGLSEEWLQQFRLAVTIGDLSEIHNAIASISSSHQDLAVVLNDLVDDFRLDAIQDLLSEL
jgi:CheY-like chemotaxis protein